MSISRTAHSSAFAAFFGLVTTAVSRCGKIVVRTELDALRVDEDEAHLLGSAAHQDRRDERVDAARLARRPSAPAISTCGNVARFSITRAPGDVAPSPTSSGCVACFASARREDVAERDELALLVRHLDADRAATGDRREDAHVVADAIAYAMSWPRLGHPVHLHARCELELVARHRRADGHRRSGARRRRTRAASLSRISPPSSTRRGSAPLALPRLRTFGGGQLPLPGRLGDVEVQRVVCVDSASSPSSTARDRRPRRRVPRPPLRAVASRPRSRRPGAGVVVFDSSYSSSIVVLGGVSAWSHELGGRESRRQRRRRTAATRPRPRDLALDRDRRPSQRAPRGARVRDAPAAIWPRRCRRRAARRARRCAASTIDRAHRSRRAAASGSADGGAEQAARVAQTVERRIDARAAAGEVQRADRPRAGRARYRGRPGTAPVRPSPPPHRPPR